MNHPIYRSKGGQNPPLEPDAKRPPPHGGSGGEQINADNFSLNGEISPEMIERYRDKFSTPSINEKLEEAKVLLEDALFTMDEYWSGETMSKIRKFLEENK